MSRDLSAKGKGQDTEPVALPVNNDQSGDSSPKAKKSSSRPSLSTPTQRRATRAIDDAQSSLDSLLKSPTEGAQHGPQIISPSGRTRSEAKGRVAGPAALTSGDKPASKTPHPTYTLSNGPDDEDDSASLAIVPGARPLYGSEGEARDVPNTALGRGVALATGKLQTARDRAGLLVRSDDAPGSLGLAPDAEALHTSRRAASQWATRYATHMVVLLVVGVLVALGGLKAFTTQGAYSHDLQATESLGTDHFDDGDAAFAQPGTQPIDSMDYNLAMPRTELGGADAAANSVMKPAPDANAAQPQPPQQGQQTQAPGSIPAGAVIKYTIAQGDTLQSIAEKFNVMPETVMGSNGIYDSDEILAAGSTLMIPPIDGMYYVPKNGDTLQSVADRFQVGPDDIAAYAGNKLQNGQVVPGQPLVVPSGMIPPRVDTVAYTVRQGDTLKGVAARYGIDVPTILDSNDVPHPDSLTIGTQLRLLPLPGVEYKIQKGDTILAIANKLAVSPQMILDYPPNNLTADTPLQVDRVIMVPGGSPEQVVMAARVEPASRGASRPPEPPPARPEPPKSDPQTDNSSDNGDGTKPADTPVRPDVSDDTPPTPKPKPTAKPTRAPKPTTAPKPQPKPDTSTASANSYKSGTGSLIWPVNGTITQYFSSAHNGLDIAISAGTPIHAADAGKVVWAGWRTDGLGYCVIIDHLDGYSTVYGHMIRQPAVYVGQYVSRSQVIGYIGSTGHSTGPHVHFMVKSGSATSHYYRNPLSFLGR